MIDRDKLAKLATIKIKLHAEDFDPIESFGFDSPEENESAAAYVRALAERTEWGWCCVEVIASFAGMRGCDFLGGCSYESEESFRNDGYFADMVNTAIDELARELESVEARLPEVQL